MSRAIGDEIASSIGVICTPEISEFDLEPTDEFLILCSDGVWEFLTDKDVAMLASRIREPAKITEQLASISWQRWIENEVDVVDDITAIVCDLSSHTN